MYVERTADIEVSVTPFYVEEQSNPEASFYFYAYRVTIENFSTKSVKLLSRHWIITDGTGKVEEVIGEGVVGEQPEIAPSARYTYQSACPLRTPTGNMRGRYHMEDSKGVKFSIQIPLFFFRHPNSFH